MQQQGLEQGLQLIERGMLHIGKTLVEAKAKFDPSEFAKLWKLAKEGCSEEELEGAMAAAQQDDGLIEL